MEPRFGHDFGHVRVHTDAAAVRSATEVNARAYTVGRDVVFGAGQFTPDTDAGRRLLAHELSHVIQQSSGARSMVQRVASTCPPDWLKTVTSDHIEALDLAARTAFLVESWAKSGDKGNDEMIRSAIARNFKTTDPAAQVSVGKTVSEVFWKVIKGAKEKPDAYDCDSFPSIWCPKEVVAGGALPCKPEPSIRVCDKKYFRSGYSKRERASFLVHEWMHKYGCMEDVVYLPPKPPKGAPDATSPEMERQKKAWDDLTAQQAIQNPDSYRGFLLDVNPDLNAK
jgi:hypothetical protein